MGAGESKAHYNYQIRGQVPLTSEYPQPYSLWSAVSKSTNERVCVFYCSPSIHGSTSAPKKAGLVDARDRPLILNGIQRLKTIRHPGILRFKDAEALENVYLVTEPVIPLRNILRALPAEEVLIGVHTLLKTIAFLHSQQVSHNRITIDSLFVAETRTGRRWLLGGFELATNFDEPFSSLQLTPERLYRFMPPDTVPPEDLDASIDSNGTLESRDAFSLGQLISEIIAPFLCPSNASSPETKASPASVSSSVQQGFEFAWRDLQEICDRMCARNPARRPKLDVLLASPMFKDNAMLSLVDFFGNIRTLTPEQKLAGFRRIPNTMRSLPASTINAYILPLFLSKELFNEPGLELFFSELFSFIDIGASPTSSHRFDAPLVPFSTYRQYVLPFAAEMLKIREYGFRLSMLKMFENYSEHLINNDPLLFQSTLIPEILSGFNEYSDDIYVLTYKAICAIIPTLILVDADRFHNVNSQGHIHEPRNEEDMSTRSYTALSSSDLPSISTSPRRRASMGRASISGLTIPVASLTTPAALDYGETRNGEPIVPITTWMVDRNVVPKTIRCCIWEEEVSEEGQGVVLESLVGMWKKLCVIENETKRPDVLRRVRPVLRSCTQCFYLVLRVLPVNNRIQFLQELLLGDSNNPDATAWLPRIVELLVPFLKDPSHKMRQAVASAITQSIAAISDSVQLLGPRDSSASTSSTCDEADANNPYTDRLRRMYGKLPRRNVFPKSGPNFTLQSAQQVEEVEKPIEKDGDELWIHWDDEEAESRLEMEEGRTSVTDEVDRLSKLEDIRKRRELRSEEFRLKREARKVMPSSASSASVSFATQVTVRGTKSHGDLVRRASSVSSNGTENVALVTADYALVGAMGGWRGEAFVPRSELGGVTEGEGMRPSFSMVSKVSNVGVDGLGSGEGWEDAEDSFVV